MATSAALVLERSALSQEAQAFFAGQNEGGMGRWTYVLNGYWDALVNNDQEYYLSAQDIVLMARHIEMIAQRLKDCRVLCEIGPGASETIKAKTIPLIRALRERGDLSEYMVIDGDESSAHATANMVRDHTNIATKAVSDDFFAGLDVQFTKKPKAFLLLGSTIGNLHGTKGDDGRIAVQKVFNRVAANLEQGDAFIFSFDTETREDKLRQAYNGNYNADFCLSFLHLIKRDCVVTGDFDPHVWRHESVWCPQTQQMAHIVFPSREQNFMLDGQVFQIPAGQKFVMNNSYKFSSDTIRSGLETSGLKVDIHANGNPMALAIAYKAA